MSEVKVHDATGMTIHDISVENERTYFYGNGESFTIRAPKTLYLKQDERGDSHRVVDKDNATWYVRRGWVAIRWKNGGYADPVQF